MMYDNRPLKSMELFLMEFLEEYKQQNGGWMKSIFTFLFDDDK
jgi:hypothetical protein